MKVSVRATLRMVPLALLLLAPAGMLLGSRAAHAQLAPEAEVEPAPLPPELPEADPEYLAPLQALTGDEEAFLDMLWSKGNEQMKRINVLAGELAFEMPEEEYRKKQAEMAQCAARLEALRLLGIKHFEHSASAHNFNGTVLYDVFGKQMEAVKEWLTSVSLDSNYSDPHNNLGMHYFHAGEYTLGFKHMDRALELEPKNADYCYNMAQNYLIFRPQSEKHRGWDAARVYKEAMKLSKKAAKLAPDDFEIVQDYAVNFIAAENFGVEPDWKSAVKAWQSARKLATTDVDRYFTWLNEGRAWRAMDNRKEAKRCFEESLKLQPNSDVTKRLLEEASVEE